MAILGTNTVTLSDIKARLDPNGILAKTVEVLNLENQILSDMPWLEGNLPTGNQTTLRSSIPTVGTRALNDGAAQVKSTTKQVTDTCCLLEQNSEIDRDVLAIQNNPSGYRLSEDLAVAEGFRQKVASLLFYGDTNADATQFNGFAPRFSTMVGANKGNASYQVVDAGGTGSVNTSAWFVNWGENSVCGIFPQNSTAGLKIDDMDIQRVLGPSGNPFYAYCTNLQWKPGLAVQNYRGVVRVANIDTTNLQTFATGSDVSPQLIMKFILAMNRIGSNLSGQTVLYVNELVYSYFQAMLSYKGNVYITQQTLLEKAPQLYILGIPVKKCDALLNSEARVI